MINKWREFHMMWFDTDIIEYFSFSSFLKRSGRSATDLEASTLVFFRENTIR